MPRLLPRLLAVVVLALAGAGLGPARGAERDGASPPPVDRRILVMLRMAPPHFRPNSAYGGSYGDGEGRSARWRIARHIARQQGASVIGEWPMPLLGVDCYVMLAPPGRSPDAVAAQLSQDPAVSWSQPMHAYQAQGEPPAYNDPLYPLQPAAREWRLAELHRIATGQGVRVAVIDSLIDRTQPDLAGQIETLQNFVAGPLGTPEEHGTAVAGIIVARPDNRVGIVGVAPRARLLALRACWQQSAREAATVCDSLSLAKALEFAIEHGAQVINMSLSGPSDLLLSRFLDIATARGVVVVAAYDRHAAGGGFPASHRGVVPVVDEGAGPPIPGVAAAPGRDIPTTAPGDRWVLVNGSSYAAAHVSGLFALLRQRGAAVRGGSALVLTPSRDAIDACSTLLQRPPPSRCVDGPKSQLLATNVR